MTEEQMAPSVESETKPDSVGSMLTNVFFEPKKVFHRLKLKPTWILPLFIVLVLITATTVVTTPLQMEAGRQRIQNSTELTPDEKEKQLSQMEIGAQYAWIGTIAAPIVGLIIFFVIVGVLMLLGSLIMGGDASFSQVASIYAWSGLIAGLGMIVKTPLMLWKNSPDIRTSLAIILPGSDTSSFLYHLLNSATDVFLVWQIVVLIMGIAIVYNFSKGKAAAVVLVPTVVGVGIGVTLATVFS